MANESRQKCNLYLLQSHNHVELKKSFSAAAPTLKIPSYAKHIIWITTSYWILTRRTDRLFNTKTDSPLWRKVSRKMWIASIFVLFCEIFFQTCFRRCYFSFIRQVLNSLFHKGKAQLQTFVNFPVLSTISINSNQKIY